MTTSIGVSLTHSPKLRYFSSHTSDSLYLGANVVVRTPRGLELGTIKTLEGTVAPTGELLRLATSEDFATQKRLHKRSEEVLWWLKAKLRQDKLPVKVMMAEFTLDQNHLTVLYSSEERVDLRKWITELSKQAKARIEFLPQGPRDQTASLGAIGACGMEVCCTTWLQDFAQVSIKMARDQQLPLSPEKISGPCGRLLCCLQYEHDQYLDLLKDLPKKNTKACTSEGVWGKVAKISPLTGMIDLISDQGSWVSVHVSNLDAKAVPPATSTPEQANSSKKPFPKHSKPKNG